MRSRECAGTCGGSEGKTDVGGQFSEISDLQTVHLQGNAYSEG